MKETTPHKTTPTTRRDDTTLTRSNRTMSRIVHSVAIALTLTMTRATHTAAMTTTQTQRIRPTVGAVIAITAIRTVWRVYIWVDVCVSYHCRLHCHRHRGWCVSLSSRSLSPSPSPLCVCVSVCVSLYVCCHRRRAPLAMNGTAVDTVTTGTQRCCLCPRHRHHQRQCRRAWSRLHQL